MKRDTIIEIALLIFTAAVLILFICFGLSTVSGAEDYELYGAGYDSAQIEITYTEPSTYVVLIPASIDMSDGASYTFTAQSLNLSDGQMLVINATNLDDQNRMTLTSGNNTTKKVFVRSDTGLSVDQNCAAVFYGDSLVSEISFWLNTDESSSVPKAGRYAGILNFEISIVDRG
jgi:hypothetical protein